MCGIAGVLKKKTEVSRDALLDMLQVMKHRGPDHTGEFVSNRFAFGMNRLSIIDLSGGYQPIFNENKQLVIVFNGEVYNYRELREDLLSKGHVFTTNSDTEVILHLYEEYGETSFSLLRGMFAFAIWNLETEELLLVRDRFGIKPLFYLESEEGFYFASEIKSLTRNVEFKNELSITSLASHFSLLFTRPDTTLFSSIRKLPPGHYMKVDSSGRSIERYYRLTISSDERKKKKSLTKSQRKDLIKSALKDSLRKHIISDVPLGVMLSGGVDSSLLAGLMKEELGSGIKSFAVGYGEGGEGFDERKYARKVAEHLGTEHHEIVLDPEIVSNELPGLLRSLDEPFANASVFSNYFLSKEIAKHVKVVLSGLGGDEIAGGYERYRGMYLSSKMRLDKMPLVAKGISGLLSFCKDSEGGHPRAERLKRFFRNGSLAPAERYFSFLSKFDHTERSLLFSDEIKGRLKPFENDARQWCADLYRESLYCESGPVDPVVDPVTASCFVDMHTYMVEDLLALSDRCSMAASIEMRVPFVDHELAETFFSLPLEDKVSFSETKILLKEIAAEYVPSDVIYRRKQGFSIPITVWFRGVLKPFLEEHLSEEALREVGVFNPAYVRSIMNDHFEGRRNFDEKLFTILSFSLWCREHRITI